MTYVKQISEDTILVTYRKDMVVDDYRQLVDEALEFYRNADRPVNCLVDMTNANTLLSYATEYRYRLIYKELYAYVKEHGSVIKEAIFGNMNTMLSVWLKVLLSLTGRSNARVFRYREEAVKWLQEK